MTRTQSEKSAKSTSTPSAKVMESVAYHARITDWPADERPREKLMRLGADSLSDAELLAILLRSGTQKRTALDMAHDILAAERTLRHLGSRNPLELMRMKGVGPAKALTLVAAFELGRRLQASSEVERTIVRGPEDVAHFMIPLLRERRTEAFFVLVLDARNSVKQAVELTSGTLSASLVHPREVFKAAIDHMAASVILVHNHPSGDCEPSREDQEVTRQLVEAGKTMGIPVHDHLIIAGEKYLSFAERGIL